MKLDREVNVVAFKDGREIPLPPGTGFVGADGKVGRWVPFSLSGVLQDLR